MAGAQRSIPAHSLAHATGAADALVHRGFGLDSQGPGWIVLRKHRRRGDEVVTIRYPTDSPGRWPPPLR